MDAGDSRAVALLRSWLASRVNAAGLGWLDERAGGARARGVDASFWMAVSSAPRHVGRAALALTDAELDAARGIRRGLDPSRWTVDQAARTVLVLSMPAPDADAFARVLDRLFEDADLGELVALYQMLPLMPHPEAHRERAAEGIRTNMKAVFEAVALDNPYPAEQLAEPAFNQLVLKCLFVGSPLHRVLGLDSRVTAVLARDLALYAHERWAAGRSVSPELWRGVGPVASGALLDDLRRVLETGTEAERLAAALSCRDNAEAAGLAAAFPDVFARARESRPTWERLATGEP